MRSVGGVKGRTSVHCTDQGTHVTTVHIACCTHTTLKWHGHAYARERVCAVNVGALHACVIARSTKNRAIYSQAESCLNREKGTDCSDYRIKIV